jgi:hypothetical protein
LHLPTKKFEMSEKPLLPVGPLTPYREKASFDWFDLKLWLEGEAKHRVKNFVFRLLSSDKDLRVNVRVVSFLLTKLRLMSTSKTGKS